jgi:hypothetical protein
MPKTREEYVMHPWTDNEIEDLLRAAVMDDDCRCYCPAWCAICQSRVRVEGLRSLGVV